MRFDGFRDNQMANHSNICLVPAVQQCVSVGDVRIRGDKLGQEGYTQADARAGHKPSTHNADASTAAWSRGRMLDEVAAADK